jgi:type IV secretory pathway protease TraF
MEFGNTVSPNGTASLTVYVKDLMMMAVAVVVAVVAFAVAHEALEALKFKKIKNPAYSIALGLY